MGTDGPEHHLTTVLAGGEQIHLAPAQPMGDQALTLCRRPVTGRVATQRFHRLGCRTCAVEAISCGVTSIEDLEHATINLPRFLAARTAAHPAPDPAQQVG